MSCNKRIMGRFLSLWPLFLTPLAHAHPGHELLEHGASHAFFSPDHLLVLVAVGILGAGAGLLVKNTKFRQRLTLSGGGLALVAAVAWTFLKWI